MLSDNSLQRASRGPTRMPASIAENAATLLSQLRCDTHMFLFATPIAMALGRAVRANGPNRSIKPGRGSACLGFLQAHRAWQC